MKLWVAFFRGINVGGRNILPMKSLVQILEDLGCEQVKTYIQSGNVVFWSQDTASGHLAEKICSTVNAQMSFSPSVKLLSADELMSAIEENPFADAAADPGRLHIFFLIEEVAQFDEGKLQHLKSATERFVLRDKVFYLHAPDGIGRSKLAAKVENVLGVRTTARNLRTVLKTADMVAVSQGARESAG